MLKKFIATSLLLGASSAFAGGLDLVVYGTPASVATAGNSNLTNTDDGAIVMTNPAGMAFTDGDMFTSAFQVLSLDLSFDDKGSTTGGGDGGKIGSDELMPTAYFIHHLDDQWTFGFGMNAHTGLSLEYNDSWAGRYNIQSVTLTSVQLVPSLAYKVNDKLSLGAGLIIDYAIYEAEVAVDTNVPGDGKMKYEDEDWAFGFTLGMMYQITDATRIALTYISEIEHEFQDRPKFYNTPAGDVIGGIIDRVDLDMNIPQMVKFGISHELNEDWKLYGSASWEEWSRFGEIAVGSGAGSVDADRNLNDTYGFGLGAAYKLNEDWTLMCGYRFDSSIVDKEDMTADLPSDEIHRYGLGAEYQYSENMTMGFGYSYVDLGNPQLEQESSGGTVKGEYDAAIHIATVGVNYWF